MLILHWLWYWLTKQCIMNQFSKCLDFESSSPWQRVTLYSLPLLDCCDTVLTPQDIIYFNTMTTFHNRTVHYWKVLQYKQLKKSLWPIIIMCINITVCKQGPLFLQWKRWSILWGLGATNIFCSTHRHHFTSCFSTCEQENVCNNCN